VDPGGKQIDSILYRESCVGKGNSYIKDLRIIRNRDRKNIILLDNSIISFAYQLSNGIHVTTFFGDQRDRALPAILPFLKALVPVDDVRPLIDAKIGLIHLFAEYCNANQERGLQPPYNE
jgi:RNA polymerase II subunit A small phosphatase-like protein